VIINSYFINSISLAKVIPEFKKVITIVSITYNVIKITFSSGIGINLRPLIYHIKCRYLIIINKPQNNIYINYQQGLCIDSKGKNL